MFGSLLDSHERDQLLALNQEVATRIENGESVTTPGVPQHCPGAQKLMTEDCIEPGVPK